MVHSFEIGFGKNPHKAGECVLRSPKIHTLWQNINTTLLWTMGSSLCSSMADTTNLQSTTYLLCSKARYVSTIIFVDAAGQSQGFPPHCDRGGNSPGPSPQPGEGEEVQHLEGQVGEISTGTQL